MMPQLMVVLELLRTRGTSPEHRSVVAEALRPDAAPFAARLCAALRGLARNLSRHEEK